MAIKKWKCWYSIVCFWSCFSFRSYHIFGSVCLAYKELKPQDEIMRDSASSTSPIPWSVCFIASGKVMQPDNTITWLVGGFKHVWFPIIYGLLWDNPSHWLIFSKIVKTTNQMCLLVGSMIVDVGSLRRRARHLNPWWEHNPEIPISIHFRLSPEVIQFSNFQTWDLLGLWRLQNDLSWIQFQLMGLPSWQICCTR